MSTSGLSGWPKAACSRALLLVALTTSCRASVDDVVRDMTLPSCDLATCSAICAALGDGNRERGRSEHHRKLLGFSGIGNWAIFDAVESFFAAFRDVILEGFRMVSNLSYVAVMAIGFAMLPRPLMLVLALVGIFIPIAYVYITTGGTADTSAVGGPWLVGRLYELLAAGGTMSNPADRAQSRPLSHCRRRDALMHHLDPR